MATASLLEAAAAIEAELRARVGVAAPALPAGLVGLEQEFRVRTHAQWPVDFRTLLPDLRLPGAGLDPHDPRACRTRSGTVITADGAEAEVAVPPIDVVPGFGARVAGWAHTARAELASRLGDDYQLTGYSTHLSVSVGDARNARLGALYTRTFAAGLVLLVDRATSPGLMVRPRPGRTELCGEFVDGPWLRAAAAYATGSVLACHEALRGDRCLGSLPPQLLVRTRPTRTRPGWFVERDAFGPDLLRDGRAARLRRCDGRAMRAGDHLMAAWTVARAALGDRASTVDVAATDALVAGDLPLPSATAVDALEAGEVAPVPPRSPLGDVVRMRTRPRCTVEAETTTWALTVFRVVARTGGHRAYATVPRASLGRFLDALDGGDLDALLERYLALGPTARVADPRDGLPGLGSRPPATDDVTDAAADRRTAWLLGSSATGKCGIVVPFTGIGEEPERAPEPEHLPGTPAVAGGGRRVPTGLKWAAALTVVALAGGTVYALTQGGSDSGSGPAAPSGWASGSSTATSVCGEGLPDPVTFDALLAGCRIPSSRLVGTAYRFDDTPWRTATVTATPVARQPVVGTTCKIHDATPAELSAALDPLTGFRGLSLLGVPFANLDPDALVQIGARAPDGTLRTGRGVADKTGYAEVRIPINVPAPHTVESALYYPSGDPSGPSVTIPITSIGDQGVIDGSFPGTRCDPGATLDLVPRPTTAPDVTAAGRAAATRGAPLAWLLGALGHPGGPFTVGGPQQVVATSDSAVTVSGDGVTYPLQGVAPASAKGTATAARRYHGGVTVGPGGSGTGAAWQQAFPCGPGQLAVTVCADAAADLGDGPYAAVYSVGPTAVPLAGSDDLRTTFTVGPDRYTLAYDGSARSLRGWSLTGGDPRARVLIRDNVVLLLAPAPAGTSPTYRVTLGSGARADTQPPADAPGGTLATTLAVAAVPPRSVPPSSRPGTASPTTVPPTETPQAFLAALATALSNGDAAFLRARLHPAVLARYGSAACDAYAAGPHSPVQLSVVEVQAPTTYTWTTDGQSSAVPDTTAVVVQQTTGAGTTTTTVHIALVDGAWRWFADCTP